MNRLKYSVLFIVALLSLSNIHIAEAASDSKFVVIQPYISTVDLDLIRFIGDASHSRGLKVSWYVPPNPDSGITQEAINLFKQYEQMGDSVQLSFRGVFFSWMGQSERTAYVDQTMGNFFNAFGRYPSLVASFYIDSYTLNYIIAHYPTVKGGIVYCNHEVVTDSLESKGGYYMPYYPSRYNTMTPASGDEKLNFVAMPFLHRDVTNCIKHNVVTRNLYPGDYLLTVQRSESIPARSIYFPRLFSAYINGWTPYGLVLYGLDVPHNLASCKDMITQDLDYIKQQVSTGVCQNVLDTEFVSWFRSKYQDSPSYVWKYTDPEGTNQAFEWQFTTEYRTGYVDGVHYETRIYQHNVAEPAYNVPLQPYLNNMPLGSPISSPSSPNHVIIVAMLLMMVIFLYRRKVR